MKKDTRLAGHGLRNEGRVYQGGIRLVQVGKGRCECGAESPVLRSNSQRQKWHRDHKNDIRAAQGETAAGKVDS